MNTYLEKIERAITMLCELPSGDLVRFDVLRGDVVARRTFNGPVVAVWRHYQSNKPTRRNRYVTLNCERRAVTWKVQA